MSDRSGLCILAIRATFAAAALGLCASAAAAEKAEAEKVTLSASDAAVTVDRATGMVTSIRVGASGEEMVRRHPAGSELPSAYVEVVDQLDHRRYRPLSHKSSVSNWKLAGEGPKRSLSFTQQYAGAPFSIAHTFRPTPAGIRWEAALRLAEGEKRNRSVQVSWMLPLPMGWMFWGPNDTTARRTDGVNPYRFVYGHTDHATHGLIIPLVGVWGRRGGAAVFSPPDVRKVQIIFDVFTQDIGDPPKGVFRKPQDLQMLRVLHDLVGLRPGKELRLAVCLAGTRGDWRGVMGHYVGSYPELFEPVPAARKYEGMYGITNASRIQREIDRLKTRKITCLEIHGHFPEYGVYVTAEAMKDPDLKWRCRPHLAGELSLASNRRIVTALEKAGMHPFMYFYNVHANEETIKKRWPQDMMVDERGRTIRQYHGEPGLRALPGSGFGKHLIEQMDLLLKAYPEAPGFFVDNFSIQWLSVAQDDGVTMIRNRPGYDMNRNHQDVGPICFAKAHKAGKIIMVNKLATIESGRGVDMVLVEHMSTYGARMHAFACVYRSFFPLEWSYRRGSGFVERCMQHLLIWGGTPAATISRRRTEDIDAYRPLTDAMIGKRWVFDADPLRLPAGYEGQIFRIDKAAPRAGDVVVTVVDLTSSWRDEKLAEGKTVEVNLPESDELTKATWISPGAAGAKPRACEITRSGKRLTVALPPVGAAGVLRLSR